MDVRGFFALVLLLLGVVGKSLQQVPPTGNRTPAAAKNQARRLTYRGLFQRSADHRLSAIAAYTGRDVTVEECATRCVRTTDFQCKSFDYDNTQRSCLMFTVNLDDRDIHLISSTGRDHYSTAYTKLFDRLPNHMLTTSHNRRVPHTSIEECARRCMLETQFKCRGFDYELAARTCWLTELSPEQALGINVYDGWDYYQRSPDGPLDRFVNYGFGHMRPLQGTLVYHQQFRGVSLDSCATFCLAATDFHCLSFDYNFVAGVQQSTCHLSQFIAANVYGLVASNNKRTLHYERKEEFLNYFYATPYAVVLGNNHKQYSRVTPNKCAKYCLQEETFVCRSFDYKIQDGTCILSSKTGSDVGGLYNQGFQEVHHFEMKPILDCGGTLQEPSGGFASPNWPRNYAHHENCTWNITVHKYKVLKFQFTHLDLGLLKHNPCSDDEDRVQIQWTDSWRGEMKSVCVQPNTKQILTNSNHAVVSFHTNSQVDGQGFRVFYSEEWPCDTLLSKAPGEFASPNYPETYPHSSRCSWRIMAPTGYRVKVIFTAFALEQNPLNHCNAQFDHVLILDGGTVGARRIGLYCGAHEPFTVRSSGRDMFVQFRSDVSTSLKGFHATYDFESESLPTEPLAGQDGLDLDDTLEPPPKEGDPNTSSGVHAGKTAKSISGSEEEGGGGYKTAMWASLSTLLVVLIIFAVLFALYWRRKKQPIRQTEVVTEDKSTVEAPKHLSTEFHGFISYFRKRLPFWRRDESEEEEEIPEEVPLQESSDVLKQNNVIDLTKPIPAKRSFSNMLYDDPYTKQNNLNWKMVNSDVKQNELEPH